MLHQLPISRRGLTDFTYARYLAPFLCGYEGRSLFLDSDMLLVGDVAELFKFELEGSVAVVRFEGDLSVERPSVMLFNNEKCQALTPKYIEAGSPQSFDWAEGVGHLPPEWNYLVGYSSGVEPKLLHFTQGVPGYRECRGAEYAQHWHREKMLVDHQVSWFEVMGNSVHARPVLESLQC